jgi:hypothetical protein
MPVPKMKQALCQRRLYRLNRLIYKAYRPI